MKTPGRRFHFRFRKALDIFFTYLGLLVISAVFLFPCLWLVLASFSKSGSIYDFAGFFPGSYSFDTFRKLFTDTVMYNYPRWFGNTLFIAVMSALFGTLLLLTTAYVISRYQFKTRRALMKGALILGMFPSFMGMTAVYILMTQLKMVNSSWGLILIYSCNAPMGYLVQKGFFDSIPGSVYEAALIDGATHAEVFRKVTLPLAKPIIVYTALSQFTWPWSDYILPKLLLTTKDNYTVAVGLMSLGETEFARFAAGAVFIAVPIILLYFFLSKFLVNGMTAGAVKE